MGQISVGGGNHADVYAGLFGIADAQKFVGFQYPQQFGLQIERHLANFVQEDCAFIRFGKESLAVAGGPGEGSGAVAEEFALQNVFAQRSAVYRHKRSRPARAAAVNRLGKHLFSGAGFAGQ